MNCSSCFNSVDNGLQCSICKRQFHKNCSNVSSDAVTLLADNPNIVFNCNVCLKSANNFVATLSSLVAEVGELKSKINDLINAGSQPLTDFEDALCSPSLNNSNAAAPPARKRNEGEAQNRSCVRALVVDESSSTSSANAVVVSADVDKWQNVTRRKKKMQSSALVGERKNVNLDVVVTKKWVHVSSFKPNVSHESIINYVNENAGIPKEHIVCCKLIKRNADLEKLTKISFKLGVSPHYYDKITQPSLWPVDVRVRPFVFFIKDRTQKTTT